MAIDFDKLVAKREEVDKLTKGGGDFWKIPVGETKFYLHDQCRPEDEYPATGGYNFIQYQQHYGTGKKGHACLDPIINVVFLHPVIQKYMVERKKDKFAVTAKSICPTCKGLRDGVIKDASGDLIGKPRFVFGVTPMYHRLNKTSPWVKLKFEPRVLVQGQQVFGLISEAMITDDHSNICDPKAAVLLIVTRKGTGFGDTKYEMRLDSETLKKPLMLDKGRRRLLSEAMAPGGSCDLFRIVSHLVKSPLAIKAATIGVAVDEDEVAGDGIDQKACFGLDYNEDDSECTDCQDAQECAAAKTGEAAESKATEDDIGAEVVETEEAECAAPEDDAGEADVDDNAPEADEVSEDDEDEINDPEEMHCWGTWEEDNEACQGCKFREQCANKVAELEAVVAAEAAAKKKPVGKGKPAQGSNNHSPIGKAAPARAAAAPAAIKAASVPAKKAVAPAGKAAPAVAEDDDPDLAAIQAEADKLIATRKSAPVAGRASAR